MNPRVYFYANIGDLTKPGYGGGEEGNRRTLHILKSSDIDVITIPKYTKATGKFRPIRLGYRVLTNYLKYTTRLLFGRRKKSLVHVSGFYGVMIYWELLLILTAKILGYKIAYEMRGGGAGNYYNNGGHLYRFAFSRAIKLSDSIFSQGLENFTLLKRISSAKDIFYYPNYVMDNFPPKCLPKKPTDRINLIYFGRLSKTKHIELIVKATSIIKSKISLPVNLTLIGAFDNIDYKNYIESEILRLGLNDNISIISACNHDKLASYLEDKHIYMFPTTEPREGHSNALTEAMSYGIVPITTNQGFNESVVNDNYLIIPALTAEAMAQRVINIFENNLFDGYSIKMYERIVNLYSYSKVSESLINQYHKLI